MGLPFFSSQSKKRDQVVAVDLGGRTTKAVHLQRRGEKLALLNYALIEAPATDKAPTPELLAEHLRSVHQALEAGRARQLTLAVGVNDTIFRQAEVPLMPASDLRMMLKYNSKTYLQQDLSDYVFDCTYIASALGKAVEAAKPGAQQKQRAFVGGARRQFVTDAATAIKSAGWVPDQIVPALLGPVNAFELAEPEAFAKEIVALVDVGFKNSFILILDCGEVMLNRVVHIGGDRLTASIVETMSVSYGEAEQIKLGMPAEVQPSLEPTLQALGRELRASIDFFEHQHDKTVGQVLVSGGPAQSELVVQALQNELMVACRVWNAMKGLDLALDPQKMGAVEQVAQQLNVAIGAGISAY
jgi:type IV pilus assembly protein PilM